MKRQIRKNVFETNSSSTHAICIPKNKEYNHYDYVEFEIGEFGWEFGVYNSIHSKASYLITAIYSKSKARADELIEKLKGILDKNNIEYVIPKGKLSEATWCEKPYCYYSINGYIDHPEDLDEFLNVVLSDEEALLTYLFGNSVIVTGNDNCNEPFDDYLYECMGVEHTKYGDYKRYGELKPEFKDYDIYMKGN